MTDEEKTVGNSTAVSVDRSNHADFKSPIEKHAHDADEAMKAMENVHGESLELDEGTNRRLLRTIDWHLMPIMCFVYGIQYLDSMSRRRNAITSRSNQGVQRLPCPTPL